MRRVRTFAVLMGIFSTIFAIYLWTLYGQLKTAFYEQSHFIPTRIYSDVTRISPPQTRASIEDRLKSLNYTFQATGDQITFTLHQPDYPLDLIPEDHPILDEKNREKPITLNFTGSSSDSLLQSLALGNQETSDLYLEPELVATLSKNGDTTKKQIRDPLKFSEIPAQVWQAMIAIEDQHFMEHNGLDPRGIARAIWVNLRTRSFAQGGSTITQQLVKNLMERRSKNLFRKVNELFLAILLEATFEKEQILERYLNEVYLGQVGNMEIHGVAEGAKHFFGKDITELNLGEITLMAGLIRGPGYYSPYRYKQRAVERQHLVLTKMVETGQIAEAEASAARQMPIRLVPPQSISNKAPYFTDFVKAELIRHLKGRMTEENIAESGLRVYTSLDVSLNAAAQTSIVQGITQLENKLSHSPEGIKERLEGALASVDHSQGYIRALVGGRNYSESTFNRILNMKRQVGSTFKPIVYLAALQKGLDKKGVPYAPGHPIEDAPWTLVFDRGKQSWSPKNYEKTFQGWISYRKALAHSINTAAAKLGWQIGIPSIIETARTLGIESDLPAVPSLALGVAELSPIELLRTYATFANHGIQEELTVIRAITQEDGTIFAHFVKHPKQVLEAAPMDLLTDMLQSVFTEGTAHGAMESMNITFDRPAAGKTGTTSNFRDAWFAGYTPQLTTVVWVGTDQNHEPVEEKSHKKSNKARHSINLTGATSAFPVWVNYMKKALEGEPLLTFPPNDDLIDVSLDQKSGMRASTECPAMQVMTEKFIKGFDPEKTTCEPLWPSSEPKVIAR